MSIVVAHEPDFRLVGRVAYETGQGEQSARKEQMARQEAQQAAQRALAREQMAAQAAAQQRQINAQLAIDKLNHQQQIETMGLQNENAVEQHKAFGQIDDERAIGLDKSRYTLAQQRKIEELTEKINWVDQQPWKPEEKEQAKKQLQWQYATGSSKSPWAQESPRDLASKSTFIDENGHRIWVNSQTGEIKDLDESASKTHTALVQKSFLEILKIPKSIDDTSSLYTPQQAMQLAQQVGMMQYPQFYPEIAKRKRTVRAVMENPQEFLKTMAGNLFTPDEFGVPQMNANVAADLKAMQTLFELGDEDKIAMVLEKMGIVKPLPYKQ
ncbi:MAG: hypothetical protein Q7T18_10380 [Sedimentisphaerales bacterium]|nr:hypothetical protein [Sedimentisphaerales bacterium]